MEQGATALYDAMGDLITNIPPEAYGICPIELLVLTDGEENASKRFTAASVVELMKKFESHRENASFKFVNLGKSHNTSLLKSIEAINSLAIRVLVVEDNAQGMAKAMSTVSNDIITSSKRGKLDLLTKSQRPSAPMSSSGGSHGNVNANNNMSSPPPSYSSLPTYQPPPPSHTSASTSTNTVYHSSSHDSSNNSRTTVSVNGSRTVTQSGGGGGTNVRISSTDGSTTMSATSYNFKLQ